MRNIKKINYNEVRGENEDYSKNVENFLNIINLIDDLEYAATKLESTEINHLVNELSDAVKETRLKNREFDELLKAWNEEKQIELNYNEYQRLTEWLIMHETPFSVEIINDAYDYIVIERRF